MDPVFLPQSTKDTITMTTPTDIIFARRVRLLELADELGNVSLACRQMGISRTRYYQWRRLADAYGLEALMPKHRRRPQQPNETPTHIVADLLTVAVVEPTLGCRQLADRLTELGYVIGKTTVQRILVDHGLGRRRQRIARAAALAALAGIVTGLSWPVGDPHRRLGAAALEAGEREEKGLGQVNRPPQRTTRSRR